MGGGDDGAHAASGLGHRGVADALRELKRFRFSCALVDLGLPDGEGVRNVARIREADPGVAIKTRQAGSPLKRAIAAFRSSISTLP